MGFSVDYCCEQIEQNREESLPALLRKLAGESLLRRGSHGNTCRLLRVLAARVESDCAGALTELRKIQRRSVGEQEYVLGVAADIIAEKLGVSE